MLTEHPYLYCDHNPVSCTDPSGHVAGVDDAAIIVSIVVVFLVAVTLVGLFFVVRSIAVAAAGAIGPMFSYRRRAPGKDNKLKDTVDKGYYPAGPHYDRKGHGGPHLDFPVKRPDGSWENIRYPMPGNEGGPGLAQ